MIKIIKNIILFPVIVIQGMLGGQGPKWVRRFLLPFTAIIGSFQEWGWKSLAYLLLIPLLCMGYGEKSIFMQVFHNDAIVRIVYGICLGLPFFIFQWWRGLVACALLAIAFLIRAGSLGQVFGMDVLIEDIVRYGALAILIVLNNLTARKS